MRRRAAMSAMHIGRPARDVQVREKGSQDHGFAKVSPRHGTSMCLEYGYTDRRVCSIVDHMQQTLDQHSIVSARLFPGRDVADLALLDREQLLQLALSGEREPSTSTPAPPATSTSESVSNPTPAAVIRGSPLHQSHTSPDTVIAPSTSSSLSRLHASGDPSVNTLDTLEQAPELDTAADEVTRRRSVINAVSDDVNGLSFSLDKTSSYVGVSSINAALKAIFKIAPQVQSHLQHNCPPTALPSRAPSPSLSPAPSIRSGEDSGQFALPPPDVAEHYIDSYFDEVHAMMPMIDEDAFRHTFLYDERTDAPWLALFNVVLALGSLACGTCDSREHLTYAKRARQILRQKSLGSNHLFVLQAHGLLSGYYLHWLNRPNEAHAMMGATMRIASAVGIHREYDASCTGSRAVIPPEIRRRTWWSLVCLDTWASMTTGRPSFGRLGPGITVKHPVLPLSKNNKQYLASLKLLPLVHSIEFCVIATRIQDLLATKPLLCLEELTTEDAELVKWHDELPPILRYVLPNSQKTGALHTSDLSTPNCQGPSNTQPSASNPTSCPALLRTPRAIMHWWYLNLRILMHRPYLIAASLCRVPEANLSEQDIYAIRKCRVLAGQAITTIDQTCQDSLIAGWNAVWLMYQAVMVPLISLSTLYTGSKTPSGEATASGVMESEARDQAIEWEAQVKTAIRLFDRMSSYSLAATRSKVVIESMLQACKDLSPGQSNASESRHFPVEQSGGIVGVFHQSSSANSFGAGVLDFDFQDPDMGFSWDDMAWESTSNTFENVPFADAYLREFQDAFEM
jgi:hypothetical protein